MKVDSNGENSSFRKLVAGRVEKNEDGKAGLQKSEKQISEAGISEAVKVTSDAAATVSRVAESVRTEDGTDIAKDVAESNKAASSSSVEDVERLADALADRIKDTPGKAFNAQANQITDKVFQLLQ